MKQFFALLLIVGVVLSQARPSGAENTGLSEEKRAERRVQFNTLVERELAKSRAKVQQASETAPKPLYLRAAAGYGYESNPNLDSSRKNDSYYELSADAEYQRNHEGVFGLGPGVIGLESHVRYTEYEDFFLLDYETLSFGGFADTALNTQLKARFDYSLNFLRYISDDSLNYHSHRIKSALEWSPAPSRLQAPYVTVEWKDYSDRKSLGADNSFSNNDRNDFYLEPGWAMRTEAWKKIIFGLSAAYKYNDSSDLFLDFNDYTGWKMSAFLYRSFIGRIAWIGFAGYDRKDYSSRLFAAGSDRTETDDFYYGGTNLYYQVTPAAQLVFSYMYKQNVSNDPTQEYSGYTLSTGFSYSI